MRFLVTGASGFVGCALVEALCAKYGVSAVQGIVPPRPQHEREAARLGRLQALKCDLIVQDLLDDGLTHCSYAPFTTLYHLAACGETERLTSAMRVNDEGTERLLTTLGPRLAGTHIIYTGTLASIDRTWADDTPQDESYPCAPRHIYGQTKLRAEEIVRSHAPALGYAWTILRLPTIYGPGFRPGGMFELIGRGLYAGSLTTALNWPGRLSLLSLADLVRILLLAAETTSIRNDLFNLSSGQDPTFDEIISYAAQSLGRGRRRLPLPRWLWRVIRLAVWSIGQPALLPFSLRTGLWRLSLIVCDGIVADARKLQRLMPIEYEPLEAGFAETYRNWQP